MVALKEKLYNTLLSVVICLMYSSTSEEAQIHLRCDKQNKNGELFKYSNRKLSKAKVTCPNLPVVYFVTVLSQTGSNYNDTIVYKCIYGYKRTGGNLVRTCKMDSHWDGIPPLCSVKKPITTILKQNSGPIIAGGLILSGFFLVPIAFCCLLKRRSKFTNMDTSSVDVTNIKEEDDFSINNKPSNKNQIYGGRQYGNEETRDWSDYF